MCAISVPSFWGDRDVQTTIIWILWIFDVFRLLPNNGKIGAQVIGPRELEWKAGLGPYRVSSRAHRFVSRQVSAGLALCFPPLNILISEEKLSASSKLPSHFVGQFLSIVHARIVMVFFFRWVKRQRFPKFSFWNPFLRVFSSRSQFWDSGTSWTCYRIFY